jgi:5-methyltetrahydrofolate--homocysteine methyltransferase
MNRLSALLTGREPVLFDGAMGTLLQERGLTEGGAGELWNVDRPDVVRQIHQEYASAGATFLTTNTFGGTKPRLAMHGLDDRVLELNEAAARVAAGVAQDHDIFVAGCLGPTGELLAPMGTMDNQAAEALFEQQLVGLLDGGIDVVLIETMSDLAEVDAAVNAARRVAPGLPLIATMSFDTNLHTMMGTSPEIAVKTIADTGVDAVGANCGRGPAEMEAIMSQMVSARSDDLLLIAQSNAGLPQLVGDRFEYDAPVDEMARHAVRLRELGVDLVGSCCGSTPTHVAAMHSALSAIDQ